MKKLLLAFVVLLTTFITLLTVTIQAQTLVDQWGSVGGRRGAAGGANVWKITTGLPAGSAGIAGAKVPGGGVWASIRGGFATLTATTDKAVIVKGVIEFVGSGPVTWSGLRYGLYRQDSISTLQYAGTDSAAWKGLDSYSYGYMFTPHSGTNDQCSWGVGGVSTQGVCNGGTWLSTYGATFPLGKSIDQAPARANFSAGKYDFAISVQPVAGGNELRYYMVKQGTPAGYWIGGILKDTSKVTATFNSIVFGLDPNYDQTTSPISAMKLSNVTVDLGTPITIPEAPWQPFYVDQWGSVGGRRGAAGGVNVWKIVQDPDSIIGNCGIAGAMVPGGGVWASLRGGFMVPVTATASKAVIVKGVVEFVGSGPVTWSGLRYGLFRQDSISTLQYPGTDSAAWKGLDSYSYGYMFTPHSGTNDQCSWGVGGLSTQGVCNGGTWLSTYGATFPLGKSIDQAPARANFGAGKYDFAISVQPVAGGNEVRFYMIKQDTKAPYWFGGTILDTSKVSTTYNSIVFGLDPNYDPTTSPITAMKLSNVKVDMGAPITVPDAPWQDYYVDTWGFNGGTGGWNVVKDPDGIIGNVSVKGTAAVSGVMALRGGFFNAVTPTTDPKKALIVKGSMEFVGGGFETANSLRMGLFYSDSAKVVKDSAWTGTDNYCSGYMIIPRSGTNDVAKWGQAGTSGTAGAVVNGKWSDFTNAANYQIGNILQGPGGAIGKSGVYKFQISVQPRNNKNEVRYLITKDAGKSYFSGGIVTDSKTPFATSKFNAIGFALSSNTGTTGLKLTDVQVTMGAAPDSAAVTGVEEENTSLPTQYALNQNFPNPFNPTTTIKFALPHSGKVSLIVYDMLGRSVATLVNSELNAGYHTVNFNASSLASGVYFYRIEAGSFVDVKKLMLLK